MSPKKTAKSDKNNAALYGGIIAFGLIVTVGAILFGRADKGEINVSATIANTNVERAERGESAIPRSPRADPNNPNGGLVGKGKNTVPQPESEPEAEDVATSTDEEGSEGEGNAENADLPEEVSAEDNSEQ